MNKQDTGDMLVPVRVTMTRPHPNYVLQYGWFPDMSDVEFDEARVNDNARVRQC